MYLIFLKNIASLIVFQECGILFFLHFLCCYAILITAMKPAKSADAPLAFPRYAIHQGLTGLPADSRRKMNHVFVTWNNSKRELVRERFKIAEVAQLIEH